MLDVILVPILEDNYAYIIKSKDSVAVIDPGDAAPVIAVLEEMDLKPSFIFNTHHHWDHVNGNKKIKEKYGLEIIGPESERNKIPELDNGLKNADAFNFGDEVVGIIETRGHTLGHICFYFKNSKILFSGDTLFSLGCGRLFEGTAEDLFNAFKTLKALPDDTQIYCGHEYTLDNAKFCLNIAPDNQDLITRAEEIKNLRNKKQPTIPTALAQEKKTNVFLMAKNAEEFKELRKLKDNF